MLVFSNINIDPGIGALDGPLYVMCQLLEMVEVFVA